MELVGWLVVLCYRKTYLYFPRSPLESRCMVANYFCMIFIGDSGNCEGNASDQIRNPNVSVLEFALSSN